MNKQIIKVANKFINKLAEEQSIENEMYSLEVKTRNLSKEIEKIISIMEAGETKEQLGSVYKMAVSINDEIQNTISWYFMPDSRDI